MWNGNAQENSGKFLMRNRLGWRVKADPKGEAAPGKVSQGTKNQYGFRSLVRWGSELGEMELVTVVFEGRREIGSDPGPATLCLLLL